MSQARKLPLIPTLKTKVPFTSLQHGAPENSAGIRSTPAVEEPASCHTSTLRTASNKASAGCSKSLFHKSCRTASRLTIFCYLAWHEYSSPLSLASPIFHNFPGAAASTWVTNVGSLFHPRTCRTISTTFAPATPLWMAWQTARQSSSTGGPLSASSHFGGVHEGALHTFLTITKRQFTPSRITAFGEDSLSNLGLASSIASGLFSRSPIFTGSLL